MPVDQSVLVIFAVAPVAVLLLFGLLALRSNSTVWAAVGEAIAHGGFALGGVLSLYFVVPRFKRLFEDFGAELPAMTRVLIGVSDIAVNYWYVFLLLIPVATALDVVAFVAFHRNPETRYVARVFSLIVTLGLLAVGVLSGMGLLATHAKLLQSLH